MYDICMKEAVFLDVKVIRKESGEVKTRVHLKETDRQRYLHMKSDHPEHTKRGIAKGQLHCLGRICSEQADFKQSARTLTEKMESRGYKKKVVQKEFGTINKMMREEALKKVERKDKDEETINFVTTFSSYLPNVKQILQENFHHLQREGLQDIIKEPPRLSLRRGRNLGDIIVDAKPKQSVGTSGPCGSCKLCQSRQLTTHFCGRGGKTFDVRGNFTCETVGTVYGMHCQVCQHIIYIGKSMNSLRQRFYAHRRDFNVEDMEKPVAHFLGVGLEQDRGEDDVL